MATQRKRRDGIGGVYQRGKVWWVTYRVDGEKIMESAGTGDRRAALAYLNERLRQVKDGTWERSTKPREEVKRTVRDDWAQWLETRDDVKTLSDDIAVGDKHILPFFGDLATAEVTTAHVLDWLTEMRRKNSPRGTPLSKNFIRNVNARLVTFFADMEQRGNTPRTPYAGLRKSQKPKKATRHEIAANKRVFTQAEVEALCFDDRIPVDRRVLYCLQFFTGTRFGEAAGLRWSDYDERCKPLAMLRVERQYENEPLKGKRNEPGVPRTAPVHPTLAAVLSEWRSEGFPMLMGRKPRPSDFIVPSRRGECRSLRHMGKRLREDLERLGFKPTEQTHGFRRAFKTIACANGAPEVWIERVIHNAAGGVDAGYLGDDWSAMCRGVACVPLRRPEPASAVQLHPTPREPARAPYGAAQGAQLASSDPTPRTTRAPSLAYQAGYSRGYSDQGEGVFPYENSGVDGTRIPNTYEDLGRSSEVRATDTPSESAHFSTENTEQVQAVTHVTTSGDPRAVLLAMLERAATDAHRRALALALAALGAEDPASNG